ncbi:CHAD domain-containing protein [Arthrobacter sp. PAMC25284]|uniref:CHAD domain-containing protein n=1 Tax=Arthrobacter sp. PAMC25284 TaxID=2861279 RepID=UPI001C62D224|nr:CHAD domain-containing protein [Arthrobacter sp. PAMC25284]QYF89251.1 CHAD domain-containing protein [Arthrobacter sp. PAMC25284]
MATTAGDALLAYLREQHHELLRHAPGVRDGNPESIHQARAAVRRFRSLLATTRSLFDDGAIQDLRRELRWLSMELGAARDPWVATARLAELIAAEPRNLTPRPSAGLIGTELETLTAAGLATARTALDSERYTELLARMTRLCAAPPFTAKAVRKPHKTLRKLIARDEARLRRAVRSLPGQGAAAGPYTESPTGSTASSAARGEGLHEVRKAAKRLRYAAEFVVEYGPSGGQNWGKRIARAKRTAAAARGIQTILGQYQDSVVARSLLRDLAVAPGRDGTDGFTLGRLHALEDQLAARTEATFIQAWKKFPAIR